MKPVHILISIASQEDVVSPLLLGQMSKDSGVPLRISVFLHSPELLPQVQAMAKSYVQVENPLLRKLLDSRIECFDAANLPDSRIDILLANTPEQLRRMQCGAQTVVLNQRPDAAVLADTRYGVVLTPLRQVADVVLADCVARANLAHADKENLLISSSAESLVIYASSNINNGVKQWQANEEIERIALSSLPTASCSSALASLLLTVNLLRSWRQVVAETVLCGEQGNAMQIETVHFYRGEVDFRRPDELAAKNRAA